PTGDVARRPGVTVTCASKGYVDTGGAVPPGRDAPGSGAPGEHHDPSIRLLADGLGRDIRMLAQRDMDPPPLEGRHRLQLEHLAGLGGAVGRPGREIAQLALPPAAVVFDIDEHARPVAHLLAEHEVDEVLERRQALALAP